jgi:mevalonate kinase
MFLVKSKGDKMTSYNSWYSNYFVDTVQNAKNQMIDSFVFDEKIKASLKKFVESQREFTKQMNETYSEVMDHSIETAKTLFAKK